jgi:hypothetical protein
MYRIVQWDDEGNHYAFAFDESKDEPIWDESGNTITLEFDTEEEAKKYAQENCQDNGFNVGWRIEEL